MLSLVEYHLRFEWCVKDISLGLFHEQGTKQACIFLFRLYFSLNSLNSLEFCLCAGILNGVPGNWPCGPKAPYLRPRHTCACAIPAPAPARSIISPNKHALYDDRKFVEVLSRRAAWSRWKCRTICVSFQVQPVLTGLCLLLLISILYRIDYTFMIIHRLP